MSEQTMVESVRSALAELGVDEPVVAAGQFQPRGHSGSLFTGGLVGGTVGDLLGSAGDAVGTLGGELAGPRIHDAATGLPSWMIVGVTADGVYGFVGRNRRGPVGALVFSANRDDLTVQVHQRVNVRVLELVHTSSGARIELEGNRIPLTHANDVIRALTS